MPDYEKLRKNLEARGFDVTYFDTAAEAVDYLDRKLDGKAVGHGGSITLRDMGLIERLQRHTKCAATGWGTALPTRRPPPSI